ncbi:MAG: DUF4388 domain-containing protein [bacterium]
MEIRARADLVGERKGTLWFDNGAVAAAEAGRLTGEEAVYRLMTWEVGTFEMDFRGTPPPRTVEPGTQALLLEGVRRMDEWGRVAEQLPGLEHVLQVDYAELAEHLDDLGDGGSDVVRLFDGRRSLRAVIDEAPLSDLDALRLVSRLYFEGVLQLADPVAVVPVIVDDDPDDLDALDDDHLPTIEPVWVESDPPAAAPPPSPVSTPPPRVTGTVPRIDPASRSGLVDNLIRSAANRPSPRIEAATPERPVVERPAPERPVVERPVVERPAPELPRRRTPRVEPAAPPPLRPDMTSRVTADLTEEAREASAAADVAPPRHPTPADPAQAETERRFVEAWSTARGELPPTPSPAQPPAAHVEEDLLLAKEPLSRSFWLAVLLMVLVAGALAAFFLRDEVVPFARPDNAPKLGWHTAALPKGPGPGPGAPIEGDWTLPTGEGAPALIGEAAAPVTEAPEAAPEAAPTTDEAAAPTAPAPTEVADALPPAAGDAFGRLLSAGIAQHKAGKYAQAAASLAQAVKLRPADAAARVAYADALFESGKDDAALAEARAAAKLGPAAAKAHLIMGSAFQLKGQKDAAIAAYEKYLELTPTGGYAAEVRGILRTLK